ncbi:MAG TPA: histone deacetylase [Candidatus Obscuribacter sp.]|nr:histone deacetylase [Candidatus Obscuribacter sp.]
MSRLALVRDPRFQKHQTPDAHPETPHRLVAIDNVISRFSLEHGLTELPPRAAETGQIAAVHKPSYIEKLHENALKLSGEELIKLDGDTFMGAESFDTALLACGAGLVAIDAVKGGEVQSAFVAVRPPGHHALADKPMGFCLFNNVAVAARYAQTRGYQKVFIIDWDVHHGNGTQWAFYDDPSVFFTSFQQYPFWPYDSGWFTEDGLGDGRGHNMNIPLPRGTGDRGYLKAFDRLVKPLCEAFAPDLIMVSAGYDAHQDDPLGQQRISTAGYAMLSQRVVDLGRALGVPCVVFLEGGYNVKSLSESAVATMRVLNARNDSELGEVHASYLMPYAAASSNHITGDSSEHQVDERIDEVRRHFAKYWRVLR